MNTRDETMQRLKGALARFHRDETGATATEYIILLILIACFVIAIVKVYGETVSKKYQAANEVVTKDVTID